ncbi:peptidoglycan bridge formation glycyltransferase FemA/FemB family protein [Actinotalea sp. C106]|uniref:lipid II:glycine glycyltransferase FemX n=1 Tax=Actinotalea sp. C106 TaxID=2908644 RepID=UPI00202988B2|nr:peptidoglycan bridge formation glycyltransferase FemA/FemB family protein [Actinotalea sp. C106]
MTTVTDVRDRATWDAEVQRSGGHPLQLWGWGEVKSHGPWTVHHLRVASADGALIGLAQVLVRRLPLPFRALSYVPRGPVVGPDGVGSPETRREVTQAVADWCATHVRGIGVTFEPDWPDGTELGVDGARQARTPILCRSTLILDLTRSDDELLADLGRSTRADVRKGGRGVEIRRVVADDELEAVLALYRESAAHAGFPLHEDDYYRAVHRELGDASLVVAAFADGAPCSFVWCAASATTAFELYGGVNEVGRKARANAPVKWHAVRLAREAGLERYDLNGLLNDGISEFKRSFAKHENLMVGAIDVPFNGPLHAAWERGLPTAKQVVRRLRRR